MITVVGVRFKRAGKIYYFDPGSLGLAAGDGCIVETSRGVEFGTIVVPPRRVPTEEVVQPLKPVLRAATEEDYERLENNKTLAEEAFVIAEEKIKKHGLPMNLLEAEYTLDQSKLIFSFAAEGRVDFRELVKDLAAVFHTRIELRQVGVRDEAKMIGGLGPCGRSLCCATFLGDFQPVSIRMAKEQNLSLNPGKISGICGRLMCCLKYEHDIYEDTKEAFGTSCPGCSHINVDELYHEIEEEPGYYEDLLAEDTIQEVDYQMMVETAEIERRTTPDPSEESVESDQKQTKKRAKTPKKGKQSKESKESPESKDGKDSKGKRSSKRRRRPRRRKPKQAPKETGDK
jgi:cell fate regulator YaaT (PSP1 superfamily)